MKILHVCLAAFYIDGYAYQENILPRKHKQLGHDVYILASCETFVNNKEIGYIEPSSYINEDGIPVTRLPYKKMPSIIARKLRKYEGTKEYLMELKPDFVFLHDVQFLDIKYFVEYKKNNMNVTIVADGHTDYINSARGFVSKYFLHGMIYKPSIKRAQKYISRFYGTLPPRNQFMKEMYDIPEEKIAYLPLGVDDEKVKGIDRVKERDSLIKNYKIDPNDFILITGGKFDQEKASVLELIDAVYLLDGYSLIIFGSFTDDMREKAEKKLNKNIYYLGWKSEIETMELLIGADLAVFPYLHSTLWEQTAGIGTPLLVKGIQGFSHININGNCDFIELCNSEGIRKKIEDCKQSISQMKDNAEKAKERFAYSNIAKRVIEENVRTV